MYKVSVPIRIRANEKREYCSDKFYEILQKFGAKRLFIFIDEWFTQPDFCAEEIKRHIIYYRQRGIEVALWIPGLLHENFSGDYTRKVYADGSLHAHVCPLDIGFIRDYTNLIARYAATGLKLILIDDDFRMHFSGGENCFCKLHMEKYREKLNEDITQEDFIKKAFSVKPNKYRNTWLDVNGEALIGLAKAIRAKVNKVNKTVRLGICITTATEEIDGAGIKELALAFSGNTKPFIRLFSAPYHKRAGCFGKTLPNIIGIERTLVNDLAHFDGEILSEGDTYPRPRFCTPASWLEAFDTVLRMEKRFDGILKYGVDYVSNFDYETGYADAAARNKNLYRAIDKFFMDGVFTGYRVCSTARIIKDIDFSGANKEWRPDILAMRQNRYAPVYVLNDACVPYNFDNPESPVVVFGDDAKYIDLREIKNGAVIDIKAARILQSRGEDTGIAECVEADELARSKFFDSNILNNAEEYFYNYDDTVRSVGAGEAMRFYSVITKIGARHTSCFRAPYRHKENNGNEFAASYLYENAKGIRFLVLCYNVEDTLEKACLHKNYYRQRLLADAYQFFKGEPLDAICPGHPDLYIITKRCTDGKLCIGLWNLFDDVITSPEVLLSKSFSETRFINCRGHIKANKVILSPIYPYQFAGIVLK